MKSPLKALSGAILLAVSAPLIAAQQPFYTPGMHVVTVAAAGSPGRESASPDWTAMIGTGGKSKPSASSGAPVSRAALDWTSKIGAGIAADSNSGSKAAAKPPVVVVRAAAADNE